MFYAVNINKQLIHISKANKNFKYLCPLCSMPVKIRDIKGKQLHFAHQMNNNHNNIAESKIHKEGKMLLAKWGEELGYKVSLEYYLKRTRQRIDVILEKNSKKIALEYQCSPISVNKLKERSLNYHKLGIKDFWFIGSRYKINKRISQMNAKFFRFHPNLGFYLIYLNPIDQRLEIYYQILKADFIKPFYRVKYCYSLKEFQLFIKRKNKLIIPKISKYDQIRQQRRKKKLRFFPTEKMKLIQNESYIKKINIEQILTKCFDGNYKIPIYQNLIFYYNAGKYLKLESLVKCYQLPFLNINNFEK